MMGVSTVVRTAMLVDLADPAKPTADEPLEGLEPIPQDDISGDSPRHHCSVTTEWPCYTFRAEGCMNATLTLPIENEIVVIELKCPHRAGGHR